MKKTKLFFLHFAGGNRYSFQFFLPFLKDFDIVSLELPGRGKRIKENLLKNFADAAQDVYEQILSHLGDENFMIYGHSMGAYLTLRVTNMLEKINRFPTCIFVTGNAGPGIGNDTAKKYLLGRTDFIDELIKLGGVSSELLEDEDLLDFYLPILRADFQISNENNMNDESSVRAPIYAIMGTEEADVDQISNWENYTQSKFRYRVFEGDHFFIKNYPLQISQIIKNYYDNVTLFRYR